MTELEGVRPLNETPATSATLRCHTSVSKYCHMVRTANFEWDDAKDRVNRINRDKHGVSFELAQLAFVDPRRVIAKDLSHSGSEARYFCLGLVGGGVMTVRFTYRAKRVRIVGAGYWRKGKKVYDETNG